MTQMIIRGESSKKVAARVSEKVNTSYKNAVRLVQTEHSYVMNEASKYTYEDLGIEKYEFLATLDSRTCSVCGKLQTKETAKLKPTGKLNKTKVTLRFRRKYNRIRVSNLSAGDKVKSYKSSNKKIATVNKKGVIKAKKKKGKATITVNLKSGKKLKVKVTVRRK